MPKTSRSLRVVPFGPANERLQIMASRLHNARLACIVVAVFLTGTVVATDTLADPLLFQTSGITIDFAGPLGFVGSASDSGGDIYALDLSVPAVAGSATSGWPGWLLDLIGVPVSDLTDSMQRWVMYSATVALTGDPGTHALVRANHETFVGGAHIIDAAPTGDARSTLLSVVDVVRVNDAGTYLSDVWESTLGPQCITDNKTLWNGSCGASLSDESDVFDMIVGDPHFGRVMIAGFMQVDALGRVDDFGCAFGFCVPGIGLAASITQSDVSARLFVDEVIPPVAEPGTVVLLGVGLASLAAVRRRTAHAAGAHNRQPIQDRTT